MTKSEPQNAQRTDGRPKRTYEPPAVEECAEFETLALSCGLSTGPCGYTGGGISAS